MNIKTFISGGMINAYCLGKTSKDENDYIENLALLYPEIKLAIAIAKISSPVLNVNAAISPMPSVKKLLMRKIYRQQSALDKKFIPLMDEPGIFNNYYESAKANLLKNPVEKFENLYALPLPSTREVTNIAVWVKRGQDQEVHSDIREYIAVLSGTCDMYINDVKTVYVAGQIVEIPLNVSHYGMVTSAEPMFALVQRQVI